VSVPVAQTESKHPIERPPLGKNVSLTTDKLLSLESAFMALQDAGGNQSSDHAADLCFLPQGMLASTHVTGRGFVLQLPASFFATYECPAPIRYRVVLRKLIEDFGTGRARVATRKVVKPTGDISKCIRLADGFAGRLSLVSFNEDGTVHTIYDQPAALGSSSATTAAATVLAQPPATHVRYPFQSLVPTTWFHKFAAAMQDRKAQECRLKFDGKTCTFVLEADVDHRVVTMPMAPVAVATTTATAITATATSTTATAETSPPPTITTLLPVASDTPTIPSLPTIPATATRRELVVPLEHVVANPLQLQSVSSSSSSSSSSSALALPLSTVSRATLGGVAFVDNANATKTATTSDTKIVFVRDPGIGNGASSHIPREFQRTLPSPSELHNMQYEARFALAELVIATQKRYRSLVYVWLFICPGQPLVIRTLLQDDPFDVAKAAYFETWLKPLAPLRVDQTAIAQHLVETTEKLPTEWTETGMAVSRALQAVRQQCQVAKTVVTAAVLEPVTATPISIPVNMVLDTNDSTASAATCSLVVGSSPSPAVAMPTLIANI